MSKWGNDVLKIARQNPDIVVVEYRNPKAPIPAEVKEIFKYSKHEWHFKTLWESLNGPALEFNHRVHPVRRWKTDFAHIATKTAIEIEGRGHQKDSRYFGDILKYNTMAEMGWTLIRLTSDMINHEQLQTIIDRIRKT